MRVIGGMLVVAAAAGLLATGALARVAFEDNKLNFKSCDGKNLTARWRDNTFHLSVPGQTLEPAAPELKYMSWDGSCQTMSVDEQGRYKHTRGDKTDASRMINYVTWDDSKWAATRAGTDFFVVFIAGKDEAVSDAQIEEAAKWLVRNKSNSRAASALADELTAAAAE